MPIARDTSTGAAAVDKDVLAAAKQRSATAAARPAPVAAPVSGSISAPAANRRAMAEIMALIQASGLPAEKPGPMFNPEAEIDAGRVGDDNYYGKLLGAVFGDKPIRSDWGNYGMNGMRDSGVLPSTNPESWGPEWNTQPDGSYTGNVYGDRTGDWIQTGNSRGPIGADRLKLSREPMPDTGQRGGPGLHTTIFGVSGAAGGGEGGARRGPIDYHKPTGSGYGKEMVSPGQSVVDKEIVDDLAMKTGALTTFEELEPKVQGLDEAMSDLAWGARTNDLIRNTTDTAGSYTGGFKLPEPEESAAKREAREQRTENKAVGGGKKTKSINAQAYKDLDPDQKSAVDFNTLLFEATQADREIRKDGPAAPMTTEAGTEYGKAVNDVFGAETGPPIFAPNTVNLLNSIGFKTEDLDMDDFLKLKVGITQADLRGFDLETRGDETTDTYLQTPEHLRVKLQEELVQAFQATREDQVSGMGLKNLQRGLLGVDQQIGFQTLTPDTNPAVRELQDKFNRGLSMLAQPRYAADKDKVMAALKTEFTAPQWESFINYLDTASREAMQYNRPLGEEFIEDPNSEPLEYMLARDFRKHIGF